MFSKQSDDSSILQSSGSPSEDDGSDVSGRSAAWEGANAEVVCTAPQKIITLSDVPHLISCAYVQESDATFFDGRPAECNADVNEHESQCLHPTSPHKCSEQEVDGLTVSVLQVS